MVRCAALGCTSGYDSNPEKVHFFHVPNNPDEAKLWQLASRRTDITLRKVHAFCEKHFLPGDIVYKITKCDATGKVIQEIPLRRPYRKAGAVPALFPWTEFPRANDENANADGRLDNFIKDEDWDISDVCHADHDYALPIASDCTIYCTTGRLTAQMMKFSKCCTCKAALIQETSSSARNEALVLHSLQPSIIHPNTGLYNFIKKIDALYVKFKTEVDVAERVLTEAIEMDILQFPCHLHKGEVVAQIIYYYLQIKMTEFCREINYKKKEHFHVKKLSKHYKT